MNKSLLLIAMIAMIVITLNSCKKDDDQVNYFTFKKNGETVSYSSFRAIENAYKKGFTYIIAGDSEDLLNSISINEELFQVLVKVESKELYNLQDSLIVLYSGKEMGDNFSAPKIYYDFSLTNPFPDSLFIDKETTEFNLTINNYDRNFRIIYGQFEGLLRNTNSDITDSIMITGGKFRIKLEIIND